MKQVKTINEAYYGVKLEDYIPKGQTLKVLDDSYKDKVLVLDNKGFKRLIKKADVKQVMFIYYFNNHKTIETLTTTDVMSALKSLSHYDIPMVTDDDNEEALIEYKAKCLKVIEQDIKLETQKLNAMREVMVALTNE